MSNDNSQEYQSGATLLASWNCRTKEEKFQRAVMALMEQLNELHLDIHGQDLEMNLENEEVLCSCADAYRMGHEALKHEALKGES
jgi:hypothetical protein